MMRFILCCCLFVSPVVTSAQDKKGTLDHGRVMACCLDVFPHKLKDTTNLADTKNYVFRGKVISLGKNKEVSICYDVEHMRVAGAWVGKPFVYSAEKNMGPTVEGAMLFATKPGPGWAKDGKWDDPREGKEGPLPRDWVHYKGLYVHGDKVVLSYTIGNVPVLELPDVVQPEGCAIITRTLNVGPTDHELRVRMWDMEKKWDAKDLADGPRNSRSMAFRMEREFGEIGVRGKAGLVGIDEQGFYARIPPSKQEASYILYAYRYTFKDSKCKSHPDELLPNPENFQASLKGGPPRWTQTLETTGTLGDAKGPYTLDQIAIPEKNPWNASIRFAGLDFFADGRAALCTWDGDVWIVSGLVDRRPHAPREEKHHAERDVYDAGKLDKVKWKRFASGLQHPLGLKIIGGHIYTAGRDQITKLHDLNNDGEADFYENINNDSGLTLQRHEFVMDLQTDAAGNLYFCRSGHYIQSKRGDNCCIYKMSPDGKKLEKIATGFREPNGLSIGEGGTMTVADNEGNGIPQTPLYRLQIGKHYGFTPSTSGNPDKGVFKQTEKPIVWLGPKVDTSAGGQVWAPQRASHVSGGSFGPLAGQLLHTSYGNCALYSVLIDKTADPWQGAVWKFPVTFNSGIMRARFNPTDGQLYVCGLRGWGTSAVKDGQFARVRYTGKDVPIPVGFRVVKTGLEITFSAALDKAAAEDDENWAGTWSAILKKVPNAKETQDMPITAVRLEADRKTATVALEKLRVVPNFALQYRLKAADGATVSGELHGTIHRIP